MHGLALTTSDNAERTCSCRRRLNNMVHAVRAAAWQLPTKHELGAACPTGEPNHGDSSQSNDGHCELESCASLIDRWRSRDSASAASPGGTSNATSARRAARGLRQCSPGPWLQAASAGEAASAGTRSQRVRLVSTLDFCRSGAAILLQGTGQRPACASGCLPGRMRHYAKLCSHGQVACRSGTPM